MGRKQDRLKEYQSFVGAQMEAAQRATRVFEQLATHHAEENAKVRRSCAAWERAWDGSRTA